MLLRKRNRIDRVIPPALVLSAVVRDERAVRNSIANLWAGPL
jgi:hypothetical protein